MIKPVIATPFEVLIRDWQAVYESGSFTEGVFVNRFEQEVSRQHNMQAIAVSSCGAGLSILAKSTQSTVLVASNTFFATGAAFSERNHGLRFVDCNKDDFSMSVESLRREYTPNCKAVVLTHVGGGIAKDYEEIAEFCSQHNLVLFEDAAHAYGAVSKTGKKAGSLGAAAVFSFYPTKAIPAGEGGVIVTALPDIANFARVMRNYGKYPIDGTIVYHEGCNFRMDEWTACVAYHQVCRVDEIIQRRVIDAQRLSNIIPPIYQPEGISNWYKYPVLKEHAEQLGIRRFTGKIYQRTDQLHSIYRCTDNNLPNTKWVAENHVCLPVGEGYYDNMSDEQIVDFLRSES